VTLKFARSCSAGFSRCSGVNRGGIELLTSGVLPAIEVSGTLKFRGGISGFSEDGWYAVAVCNCRVEDLRNGIEEEKVRRH
jgi:hypothetical protein